MFLTSAHPSRFFSTAFVLLGALFASQIMACNGSVTITSSHKNSQVVINLESSFNCALDLINYDEALGRISPLQAIEYRGYYFVERDYLPLRYRKLPVVKRVKSATPYIVALYQHWELLSVEARTLFSQALARPSMSYYFDTPNGKFRIHYNTDGSDAVYQPETDTNGDGVPDYVNSVAAAMENVWIEETTTSGNIGFGFDPPADDGSAGGGENLYDIYLKHYSGAYGVTFPDGKPSNQYSNRNAQKSYIFIDPSYNGFGYSDRTKPMKVTAAHEFFHAIQFVYNYYAEAWFMETSSTWMEDQVYDEINDFYNYLRARFKKPYESLDDYSLAYGTVLWAIFLSEYHQTPFIMKEIWEHIISNASAYSSIDSVLQNSYGTSLLEDFQTYTRWNYITGKNDDGQHYSEGWDWRGKLQHQEIWIAQEFAADAYPISVEQPDNAPKPMGSDYFRLYLDQAQPGFRIDFTGYGSETWGGGIVIAYTDGTYAESQMSVGSANVGYFELSDLSNVSAVILITQNLRRSGSNAGKFHVQATYLSSLSPPQGVSAEYTIVSSFAGARKYVHLKWQSTGQEGLSAYHIYRASSSEGNYQQIATVGASTNTYLDEGLNPGESYHYFLRAVDSAGLESLSSSIVSS